MSTLVTGTIKSNTANPPLFQNTSGTEIGTLCRAWVNFNGTGTVAIRASYNVSSITDNGTGAYTVNLTNALSNANYAVAGSCGDDTGSASGVWFTTGFNVNSFNASQTTSSFRIQLYYTSSLVTDVPIIAAAAFN
jgi:hypothetical protein